MPEPSQPFPAEPSPAGAEKVVELASRSAEGRYDAATLVALGEELERDGRQFEAAKLYEQAIAASWRRETLKPRMLAYRRLARLCHARSELDRALHFYEHAIDLALEAGDTAEIASIATGLGNVRTDQGSWAEAERDYRRALDAATRLDDRHRIGQLWNNLALVRRRLGDLDGALDYGRRAIELFERMGQRDELARCYNHLGLTQVEHGRHEEALQSYAHAAELADDPYVLAAIHSNLCELSLRLRPEAPDGIGGWAGLDPEQQARLGADLAERHGFQLILCHIYKELGTLGRLRRDPAGAAFFEQALKIVRRHEYRHAEADVLREYALFLRGLGQSEAADLNLRMALEIYERAGASGEVARVQGLLSGMDTASPSERKA